MIVCFGVAVVVTRSVTAAFPRETWERVGTILKFETRQGCFYAL